MLMWRNSPIIISPVFYFLILETSKLIIVFIFNNLSQIGGLNQEGWEKNPLSLEKAVALVKDVFISAAERDIYTGDGILINIITKDGVKTESFPLRRD